MRFQSECPETAQAPVDTAGGRLRTKPLIPEMCFTATEDNSEVHFSAPYLEDDGTSLLISCSMCSVRVHASECRCPSTFKTALIAIRSAGYLFLSIVCKPGPRTGPRQCSNCPLWFLIWLRYGSLNDP